MVDSNNFENILKSRKVPEMRSNLEYRIIQAAKAGREVRAQRGFWAGVNAAIDEFFDGILLPAPAYSLSLVLLFALFFGLYSDATIFSLDIGATTDLSEHMYFAQNSDFGDVL